MYIARCKEMWTEDKVFNGPSLADILCELEKCKISESYTITIVRDAANDMRLNFDDIIKDIENNSGSRFTKICVSLCPSKDGSRCDL